MLSHVTLKVTCEIQNGKLWDLVWGVRKSKGCRSYWPSPSSLVEKLGLQNLTLSRLLLSAQTFTLRLFDCHRVQSPLRSEYFFYLQQSHRICLDVLLRESEGMGVQILTVSQRLSRTTFEGQHLHSLFNLFFLSWGNWGQKGIWKQIQRYSIT